MTDLASALDPSRLVDLTQPLGPDTVLWPGSHPFTATVEIDHATHGAYARTLTLPEHSGTHFDAPAHFHAGGATVAEVELAALVRPAVVLDVRDRTSLDASFTLGAADVEGFEARDGVVPAGSAVLVCTGWDVHTGDAARYLGGQEQAFPGLGEDAAALLVERGVAGIGIDTLSVDPGRATTYPVHRLTLPAGLWHLEGLVGLDRLPARGAVLVVAPIRLVGGSGAPARVLAVLPG